MEKNNKLIAEFMGNPTIFNTIHDATLYQVKEQGNMTYHVDELQYHTSWDWLVPALKKAQQEMSFNRAGLWRMITNPINYNIKDVHNQLVEFIKNQNDIDMGNILIAEVMDIHAQYSFYIERCVSDEVEGEILSFEEWKQLNN